MERGNSATKIFQKHSRNNLSENRVIGIVGLGHAVGVTHLCIMMANYLMSACGKKTAILEWSDSLNLADASALKQLEAVCMGVQKEKKPYRVLGVDYYSKSEYEELTCCISGNYEQIILDFGCMTQENQRELLRCDRQFIVASLSEWQIEAFWKFYRDTGKAGHTSWIYLVAFGSEETRIEMKKKLKLSLLRIPLSVDAFAITRDMMIWFQTILE